MKNWNPLNMEQMDALFNQHAILIGDVDRVPRFVALDLLGKEALHHAAVTTNGGCCAVYFDGQPFHYVSRSGFKAAVSYLNYKAMQEQADKLNREEMEQTRKEDERSNKAVEIALRLHPEMVAMIEKDSKGKATDSERKQISAWVHEADLLIDTEDGDKALLLPAPMFGKKRGRPRKA